MTAQKVGAKAQWGAYLFALHPVQVESVAWAIELKNVLSLFLALSSLWLYWRFERRSQHTLALATGWMCFLAALLAKTAVLPWPVVVSLLFWHEYAPWPRHRTLFVLGLFALAAVVGVGDIIYTSHGQKAVPTFAPVERLAMAGGAMFHYLLKWLVPVRLCAIYPRWSIEGVALYGGLASITTATLVMLAFVGRAWKIGRASWLCVWVVGTMAMLSPTLGFVSFSYQRQALVADRFAYHASAVFFPGLAALLLSGAEYFFAQQRVRQALAALVVCVLTALTYTRSYVWSSAERLAQDTVFKNPRAWTARYWLADALARRGDFQGATDHFAQVFWGSIEDFSAADLAIIGKGADTEPIKSPKEAFNRGLLLAHNGDLAKAVNFFETAAQDPSLRAQSRLAIAAIEWRLGKREKAVERVTAIYRAN